MRTVGKIVVILPQQREGNGSTFRIPGTSSLLDSCSAMFALVPKALVNATQHFSSCPGEINICALTQHIQ